MIFTYNVIAKTFSSFEFIFETFFIYADHYIQSLINCLFFYVEQLLTTYPKYLCGTHPLFL